MSNTEIDEIASEPLIPAAPPVPEPLVQRLQAELDAAHERVEELQTEADRDFVDRKELLRRFPAVADRIQGILQSRLESLASLAEFQDITFHTSVIAATSTGGNSQSRLTTLILPASGQRPVTMTCSFRVGHDEPGRQLLLDYRLDLQPVYIKFENHDQLILPIAELPEDQVSAWVDDRLVGFARTYFEVFFHDEYQKKCLELDPVLNIRFPRGMAVGTRQYQGHTYHFYTRYSLQLFSENPEEYIKADQPD